MVLSTALALWLGNAAYAENGPAPSAAVLPNMHKPRLALAVFLPPADGENAANWEDLLLIELANQPFLEIVDRQALQAVLKEHAIALSNLSDPQKAVALGKFAGADYLLHVAPEKKTVAIRLVEVATGQVKREEQVTLGSDLALSAAAIREKVLAALRPDSQAANRLTVGIAAFVNHSVTNRSDKLNVELQKALRVRLKDKGWAVVLERQYPTELLAEVDLSRAGLVKNNSIEKLPPADLTISGRMEDIDKEYEPGKRWSVKFDLILRLRGHSVYVSEMCHSDAIDSMADRLMARIEELRRSPHLQAAVSEKELWRRQALYLMSRPVGFWGKEVPMPHLPWFNEANAREVIRALENVLLLDDRDAEATNYLGAFLISCSYWTWNNVGLPLARRQADAARCVAGSRLVERALGMDPTRRRALSYVYCIQPMVNVAPARAKEMAQYIADHPEQFQGIPNFPWLKIAQTQPPRRTEQPDFGKLDRVLANAEKDPNAVLISFPPRLTRNGPLKPYTELLTKYANSSDPVVQFVVHRALGELLCWQQHDSAALSHFDAAIAVMEAAYQRCDGAHRYSLDDIYHLRIEACEILGLAEEAKKTALTGIKHFMDVGRSPENWSVGRLYRYCVTEALGPGEEKQALAMCDVYAEAARKRPELFDDWVQISAKREALRAQVAGKPVPDMRFLRFVKESRGFYNNEVLRSLRMAATERAVWFVPDPWGSALCWRHDGRAAIPLPQVRNNATCVAATDDAVFFGSRKGIYRFTTEGKLVRQYGRDEAAFPGCGILDMCEGGGKIYFSFLGSPHGGIAVLDPATEKMTILAPSRREATYEREPLSANRPRVRWDAFTPRVYVGSYFSYSNNPPILHREYGWSPQDNVWHPYPIDRAPRLVVSYGNETLLVRTIGEQTEFQFLRAGQKLTATVPAPSLVGEPVWDEHRIWVPTSSGLYEVDRTTAGVRWVAYEDGNPFLSLLRHGNWLYVATARGLYCGEISSAGLIQQPPQSTLAQPHSRPTTAASTNRRPMAPGMVEVALGPGSTIPLVLSLEGNADATINLTAERKWKLKDARPGTVQLSLSELKNESHYVFFQCPGYATQWIFVQIAGGKVFVNQTKVKLFRKRYVVLRCAFNTNGGRKLMGEGVEEQRLALTHWSHIDFFRQDWQIWQKSKRGDWFGDTPFLQFHMGVPGFGFLKPSSGVSYKNMEEAPASGYRCENIKAEKGLLLYCRVSGGGYGKVLVEAVTDTPPKDVRVIEQP
jgi:curli biogenesis system outer membrane secretion channel CsgG